MPQFKIRDLMINVIPEGGQGRTPLCVGVTVPHCPEITLYNCPGITLPNCPGISLFTCNFGTNIGCANNISFCRVTLVADTCPAASADCGWTYLSKCFPGASCALTGGEQQLEDLAILKEQLKQSLARVEVQEHALDESLRPQSLEEIQLLETKLTAALEDLRQRKAELE